MVFYLYNMKVIATNIGKPTTFTWNGKEEQTGIFKYPTTKAIYLGETDVENDTVIDRKHHAGIYKACYLYAAEQYPYWKELYPDLEWDWGMFGENLTIEGLDESKMCIGDRYQLGTAVVQISQPREPCYKLGVRFQNQNIIKQFIAHRYPGTYIKIVTPGKVAVGDELQLLQQAASPLTINTYYDFLFTKEKDPKIIQLILENEALPAYKKERLRQKMKDI